MNPSIDSQAREKIIDTIKRESIGPGSDTYFVSDNDQENLQNELIDEQPLRRYFSGILYPLKSQNLSELNNGASDERMTVLDEEQLTKDYGNSFDSVNENNDDSLEDDENQYHLLEEEAVANQYHPSNIGLSFCVAKEVSELEIGIQFGTYEQVNKSIQDIKVRYIEDSLCIPEKLQNIFEINNQTKTIYCINGKINYDEVQMLLNNDYKGHLAAAYIWKIIKRREYRFKRSQHILNQAIKLPSSSSETINIELQGNFQSKVNLQYQCYEEINGRKYVKVMLRNKSELQTATPFKTFSKEVNELCLFQVELSIKLQCGFEPLERDSILNTLQPSQINSDTIYGEHLKADFLYRNCKKYAVGHGVSVIEKRDNNKVIEVKSTYIPLHEQKITSTSSHSLFSKLGINASKVLNISNLRLSGLTKDELIASLTEFINVYKAWIKEREEELTEDKNCNFTYTNLGKDNLSKCQNSLNRIQQGIEILHSDSLALRAFQLANEAMYLQMERSRKYFHGKTQGFESYEWQKKELNEDNKFEWRPFQLAFLLICLKSIVEPESQDRDLVDLIWFPTGGGKTEAYLAITAFTIFYRRLKYKEQGAGVNVIMRYTLRLLTAQQFERASRLIAACEVLRKRNEKDLGTKNRISIGLWVGSGLTPNSCKDGNNWLEEIHKEKNLEKANPINKFPIAVCPWCNTKIISKRTADAKAHDTGFKDIRGKDLPIECLNPECEFHNESIPVYFIDETIYHKKPTLLFGTVDKLASLAWDENSSDLFNNKNYRKPELIVQDELHLLSGPLGSITGLFENVVLDLCTNGEVSPKIIASTATVCNVDSQINGLYGKKVAVFPSSGISSSDSFFSFQESNKYQRAYIGILPTGNTRSTVQLKLIAILLFSRLKLLEEVDLQLAIDNFWTILSYCNSLKDVGKIANRTNSALFSYYRNLAQRHFLWQRYPKLRKSLNPVELTSRIPSQDIKKQLDKLGQKFINSDEHKYSDVIDVALATNMISVGLDVSRLNLMIINGMPRNIAEYIQSSSRVARKTSGLVLALFDPNRSRDLSYYEQFESFHECFYKYVEPLSVTPFTENCLQKMLFTLMVTYFRHSMGHSKNKSAADINEYSEELSTSLITLFRRRRLDERQINSIKSAIDNFIEQWKEKYEELKEELCFKSSRFQEDNALLRDISNKDQKNDLITMRSMRSVDASCLIEIIKPEIIRR